MKNKLFTVIIILIVFSILFIACDFFKEVIFGELEIGENFWHSRDGHYKKLPHNFGLYIDLRTPTSLFKVKEEDLYVEWGNVYPQYHKDPILEGHFIKGYFDSDYLVLCEEYENRNIVYLTFEFATEEVQYYDALDEIYELLNVDSIDWFNLCNTVDEWIDIPDDLTQDT